MIKLVFVAVLFAAGCANGPLPGEPPTQDGDVVADGGTDSDTIAGQQGPGQPKCIFVVGCTDGGK